MSTPQNPSAGPSTDEHPDHWYHDLRVARVVRETADACSLVFEIPAEARKAFRYRAGQFLTLQIPFEGKKLSRCYSLSSSPDCDAEHKITIKRIEDGRISNWVNDHVGEGDTLQVLPPGGLFVLDDSDRDVVLFAGGSGITPVISIIKTALETTARAVKLVYANRDSASIIFKDELDALAARYPERLRTVHSLDDRDGYVDRPRVEREIADHRDAEFFLCGPAAFMETVETSLEALGVPGERIHIERFVSPPDPDSAESKHAEEAAQAAGEDTPATISVYLDGKRHEVPYEKGQTVLVTVQKAGLEPPFSCTDGFCGCCMAKLTAGRVSMINNDFLSKKELEKGWVLTCQSVPQTAECSVEYPD